MVSIKMNHKEKELTRLISYTFKFHNSPTDIIGDLDSILCEDVFSLLEIK